MTSLNLLQSDNPRPIYNKYCIVTTQQMLINCKEEYQSGLVKLTKQRDGLTDKYYTAVDVPEDKKEEISEVTKQMYECGQRIEDIQTAIDVLNGTCFSILSAA